jgi:4-hydroxybenzoate polyprenyltransferase
MIDWRHVIQVSRPLSWLNTALPFLVAALVVEHAFTPAIIIGTLYFLGPYNVLLHGSNDIYDVDSERRHAAADTPAESQPAEGAAPGAAVPEGPTPAPTALGPSHARVMQVAIATTNLPFLIVLVLLSGAATGLAVALAIVAAIAYSTPPLRTRERPALDVVTGAMQIVLPAVCGLLVAGLSWMTLPWLAVAAFTAWAIAAFALRAIRDLPTDRVAGVASTATTFGARVTAAGSFVGFGLAAVLVVAVPPLGPLAALALGLYLLLPAMILLARREDPSAEDAAARRAWSGFVGLAYLVGSWLALLLLRRWDVTHVSTWMLAIGLSAIAVAYAVLNVLAIRLITRRRRARRGLDDEDIAALTIVVPCRDEAWRLRACLEALLDQTYADATILVVDDGSSDETADIAAELLGGAGRVIVAPPKPEGWTGKSWACQVGADASRGELIMFVDADTILVPVATRIIVEQFETQRLDLLSGLTQYAMPTSGERASVPGFALLQFGYVPIWLSSLTRGRITRLAFAYGPLMLVRREPYAATGGHGATPGSLRDDIDLARTFARAGYRVGTVHASDLAMTRHYPNTDAVVRAWRRITLPYAGGSLALAIAAIGIETLAYVVPFVLPALALLMGTSIRTIVASFVPLLLLGAMRLALTLTQRQPLTTILWHPVTVGITLIGQFAGIVDHVLGRAPRWYGRVLETPIPQTAEPDA